MCAARRMALCLRVCGSYRDPKGLPNASSLYPDTPGDSESRVSEIHHGLDLHAVRIANQTNRRRGVGCEAAAMRLVFVWPKAWLESSQDRCQIDPDHHAIAALSKHRYYIHYILPHPPKQASTNCSLHRLPLLIATTGVILRRHRPQRTRRPARREALVPGSVQVSERRRQQPHSHPARKCTRR